MFNNALQGWTCEDRCLRLRCLVFLREMLVVALVSGFGLFLQAPDSSTAYVANDDSVFMRQLMALPLTGEMDNLKMKNEMERIGDRQYQLEDSFEY